MNKKKIISVVIGLVLLSFIGWFGFVEISKLIALRVANREGEGRQQMELYDEELVKRNPLIKELPYISDDFEVHYGVRDREAMRAFYPVVIKSFSEQENCKSYSDLIATIKRQALTWIATRGVDPQGLDIEWRIENPQDYILCPTSS
jgi:hypothetical protein